MAFISSVLSGISDSQQLLKRTVTRAARMGTASRSDPRPLLAFVNEGRWCATCPNCNGGVPLRPEWAQAACPDCFRTFDAIIVPPTWRAIEALLLARPVRHQNWIPTETVEDLERDNAAHQGDLI